MDCVRTRFAPSPTGYLHLGGLRTALYGYLFARQHGGRFILRIEDTDQEREVEGATEVIYDTLRDVGLLWDEGPDVGGDCGPYVQSERKALYRPYAEQLVRSGHAYYCFCTREEIDARRQAAAARGETFKYDKHCLGLSPQEVSRRLAAGEPHVIRMNCPTEGETSFDDMVFGHIAAQNDTLDDIVLIKADGLPTYNFANVVDDHLMGITHVMRGMEYLSSTPKYNLLYQALGWEIPRYIHLPTVMRDATHKLSKRDGDAYYSDFIQKGYLRQALINYLALVGWNPGDEREFFSLEDLVEAFSIHGISKSPAIFDERKLRWFNASYIRRMSAEEYHQAVLPWFAQAGVDGLDTRRLAQLMQERTEIFSEVPDMVRFLAEMPPLDTSLYVHKKMKTTPDIAAQALALCRPVLEGTSPWTEAELHDRLMAAIADSGMKNGQVLWPLRIALSGRASTPGGAIEIAYLLGREETLRRLEAAQRGLTA